MRAWHHLFFYIASVLLQLCPSTAEPIKGLSLNLIHRDSINSPLSPTNLTQVERLRNLIHRSKLRALHLTSTATEHPDTIHPSVRYEASNYVVELGVGTPPPSDKYYLVLDSGSDLVWLQCDNCKECFPQQQPIFKPDESSTFSRVPCTDPLCESNMCDDSICYFNETYMNNAWTTGVVSSETFTFSNESGGDVTVLNGVVFGCGYNNHAFPFQQDPNNKIMGVFGLGPGTRSFNSQSGFQKRFSYCLADWELGPPSNPGNLRFGDEALLKVSGLVETTPFAVPPKNTQMYYLNLKDITVGTKRLRIEPGTFDLKPDGSGGVVIDSGTAISFFVKGVYDMVRNAMVEYFKPFNMPIIDGSRFGLDLCYDRSSGFGKLPSLMFHFQGSEFKDQEATLVAGPFSTFFVGQQEKFICLAMLPMPSDQINILGAKQQIDNRFLYDGTYNTLSFISEACD
ncbi:hypothetical protein HHK36_018490 [Tetracentron sinense]|uniref:Peptidase A1 domain-containing protein n=1 Tax=Tetracentron sinense TaxID=13715 RepID=A0A834Z0A0_TETSI|nr:hypothetical protein HHK36_018490 [Tetracentron sinense]